ncbi:hypothetical protein DRQ36_07985 [bacterium]|nr:MAG: hypothetical protein DRQ36_07985 [bacterium]
MRSDIYTPFFIVNAEPDKSCKIENFVISSVREKSQIVVFRRFLVASLLEITFTSYFAGVVFLILKYKSIFHRASYVLR